MKYPDGQEITARGSPAAKDANSLDKVSKTVLGTARPGRYSSTGIKEGESVYVIESIYKLSRGADGGSGYCLSMKSLTTINLKDLA